jgi:hypothetical protein
MPAETDRQRRAAGAEYGRRKEGVPPQKKGHVSRPFGGAKVETLRDFASKPDKHAGQRKRGRD